MKWCKTIHKILRTMQNNLRRTNKKYFDLPVYLSWKSSFTTQSRASHGGEVTYKRYFNWLTLFIFSFWLVRPLDFPYCKSRQLSAVNMVKYNIQDMLKMG